MHYIGAGQRVFRTKSLHLANFEKIASMNIHPKIEEFQWIFMDFW